MANITVTVDTPSITIDETNTTVNVASTESNIVVGTTADVANSDIRAALSVTDTGGDGSLTYSTVTGVFTYTGSSDADKNTWLATKSTSNLSEGTNLYYTTARANSAIAAYTGAATNLTGNVITTANISGAYILGDGSQLTNIPGHLTNAQVKTYIEANGLGASANLTTTANVSGTNFIGNVVGNVTGAPSSLAGLDTDDLSEGSSNLYWTTARGNAQTLAYTGALPNLTDNVITTADLTSNKLILKKHGSAGNANVQIRIDRSDQVVYDGDVTLTYDDNGSSGHLSLKGTDFDASDPDSIHGTLNGFIIETANVLTGNIYNTVSGYGEPILQVGGTSEDRNEPPSDGEVITDKILTNLIKGSNLTTANLSIEARRIDIGPTYGTTDSWLYQTGANSIASFQTLGATDASFQTLAISPGNVGISGTLFANLVTLYDTLSSNSNITTTANVTGAYILGDGSALTNIPAAASNTQVTTYIEANGLDASANLTTSANVSGAYILGDGSALTNIPGHLTNAQVKTYIESNGLGASANLTTTANVSGGNILGIVKGEVDSTSNITTTANVSGANFLGNVTGNVTGAPSSLAGLDTDDLAEGGTNLYYTTARANTAIGAYTGAVINLTGNITTTANIQGGKLVGTEIDSNANITTTANVSAGNVISTFIGNITGNVTGSPSSLAGLDTDDLAEGGTNLYYTTARANTAIGAYTGNLTAVATTGNITTTANVSGAYILGDGSALTNIPGHLSNAQVTTYIEANGLDGTANLITTANIGGGNVLTDHIISDSGQPLQLKGQTDGILLDKTISSVESRIVDVDTTGYSVMSADFHTAAIVSDTVASLYTTLTATSGSPTLTAYNMTALPNYIYAIQEQGPATYTGYGAWGQTSLEAAIGALGGNLPGWTLYQVGGSTISLFPAGAHVVSISGSTITMSENAIATATGGVILYPGAFTSHNLNIGFIVSRLNVGTVVDYAGIVPWWNSYATSETLANVTMDRVSYGDATADLANVVMRNIADLTVSNASAVRTPRAILVGESATPDLLSIGTTFVQPATSTLGVTVEQDGLTDFGDVETTPPLKFMFNNFMDNSLAGYTTYPLWAEFLGETGNATVDMPYLGAPSFNFKLGGGTKSATTGTSAGEIPGRITWNTSTGTLFTGVDQFNPPASITTMVGGTGVTATMANVDMHFQSTYPTSYRNGANVDLGSIPRTFLSSSAGNTVIAAKTDGKITLRPVRDYGDTATTTSFIENRYAPNLHEYHEFLGAGFLSGREGTLVEIQPKSGSTNGSTSDFNYDSKGDATLRLTTHEANSSIKQQYDITSDQGTGNIAIIDVTNSRTIMEGDTDDVGMIMYGIKEIHGDTSDGFGVGGIILHTQGITQPVAIGSSVFNLYSRTTTEINAIVVDADNEGDILYNSTESKIVFYNGSAWRKLSDEAM